MGVTIAYRGRIADLTRIEDFEDRLVDLALEIGGMVRIWRTWADDNPERVVRGVILDIAPGHESTSLLLSPEGWLVGLTEIQDAEEGRLKEPPWCWTKTQFGKVEGHVALVETLEALKREFLPDLEVCDDGGYWETRDLAALVGKRELIQGAIDGLAEGLRHYGLSREAAEDPEILLRHIERVAAQVHRVLRRPSEHPPVTMEDGDDLGGAADPEATEKQWDELFKHNRRQQERLQRAIEERRGRGVDDETAFRDALREIVPDRIDEETERSDEPWRDDDDGDDASVGESLEDEAAGEGADLLEADDDPFEAEEKKRHPVLQQATDLFVRLETVLVDVDPRFASPVGTVYQGAGDAMGGLSQALSHRDRDGDDYGLRVVQFKRALRGAAFARGALFPLRSAISVEHFDELYRTLGQMETDIFSELSKLRSERRGDDW
jgi:hypothetical protein